MSTTELIEYNDASDEVRSVYDDIMATRKTSEVTIYWKSIARHPPTLRRTWETFKAVMDEGELDALVKEMVYLAVSVTNRCAYCVNAHTRAAQRLGMSEAMLGELLAVVSLANGANQLAIGYQIDKPQR